MTTLAISKSILTFADVEDKFGLSPNAGSEFFPEWQQELPELTTEELAILEHLHQRFAARRRKGGVAEGVVDKLVVSPLLDLAGFYELKFDIRTEESVEFLVEEDDEVLRGRIDTLVLQNQFWVLVIETKRTIMASLAVPQALSYMMCSPNAEKPVYGMVSNGDEFIFLKLQAKPKPYYSLSKLYSLFFPLNSQDLQEVFRVLKRIKTAIV